MGQTNQKRTLKALLQMTEGTPFLQFAGISGSTAVSDVAITGNYAGGAVEFSIIAQPGEVINIHSMNVLIEAPSVIRADVYGSDVALTNGILMQIKNGAGVVLSDLLGAHPITSNAAWSAHADQLDVHSFGAGNNFIAVRWTSASTGGRGIVLDSREDAYLAVTVNDDLSDLVDHHVKFGGYRQAVPGVGL